MSKELDQVVKSLSVNRGKIMKELNSVEYYKAFNKQGKITSEEEKVLMQKAFEGNKEASDKLILANIGFATATAKKQKFSNLEFDDMNQECIYGLIKATSKIKENCDNKLITYAAFHIKDTVAYANNECGRNIRVPMKDFKAMKKVRAIYGKLSGLYDSENECIARTASEMEISEEEVRNYLEISEPVKNLNNMVAQDDENRSYEETLCDTRIKTPEEEYVEKSMKEAFYKALERLPEIERKVLSMKWGLYGQEAMSFTEIGKALNYTRAWANSVEKKAKKHLSEYKDEIYA